MCVHGSAVYAHHVRVWSGGDQVGCQADSVAAALQSVVCCVWPPVVVAVERGTGGHLGRCVDNGRGTPQGVVAAVRRVAKIA